MLLHQSFFCRGFTENIKVQGREMKPADLSPNQMTWSDATEQFYEDLSSTLRIAWQSFMKVSLVQITSVKLSDN